MNLRNKYRKYITHTGTAGVLALSMTLNGCTEGASGPVEGNATPAEATEIQAVPETIAQLGLQGQVLPGLNGIDLPDAGPAPEYLRIGVRHEIVKELQRRLVDLGFMNNDEPTDYFGKMTQMAVEHFQRQNELPIDGIVGNVTQDAIMSPDARYYVVSKGAQGDDIERIQQCLYQLGYLATVDLVTGNFGDPTEAAVPKPQEVNGLGQDGKIGQKTINLIYSDEIRPNFLAYGEKSDVVLACQQRLKGLGYLTTTPDGAHDEDTVVAVRQSQAGNDQIVDGYLGPSIRIVLNSPDARTNGLTLGERGDAMTKVQQLLSKHGYLASGNITGYYGEATERAVENFQSRSGLTADGLVGVQAMAKLTSDNVRRPAANTGGSGSQGGLSSQGGSGGQGGSGNQDGSTSKPSGNTPPAMSKPVRQGAGALISVASSKLENPYVWGTKGPNAFDCSDLVYWRLNQVGVNQSHLTSSGWGNAGRYAKITNFNDIQVGDIVVVNGRVGIVAGGGTVIDASSSNGRVVHRSLSQWWANNFICT